MNYLIRPYSPQDRESIRYICCETGFSGKPIDRLFNDREVFADFLTRYYTDWEPESTLVVEHEGRIVGYLTGCLRYHYFTCVQTHILCCLVAPKSLWRWIRGEYDTTSCAFLKWCCTRGRWETPSRPNRAAHFHFNLLPSHRNTGAGRGLLIQFLRMAEKRGAERIYGQIQTNVCRRPDRVFERYGFRLFDRKEITKFHPFQGEKAFLSTFVKELKGNGYDIKERSP